MQPGDDAGIRGHRPGDPADVVDQWRPSAVALPLMQPLGQVLCTSWVHLGRWHAVVRRRAAGTRRSLRAAWSEDGAEPGSRRDDEDDLAGLVRLADSEDRLDQPPRRLG